MFVHLIVPLSSISIVRSHDDDGISDTISFAGTMEGPIGREGIETKGVSSEESQKYQRHTKTFALCTNPIEKKRRSDRDPNVSCHTHAPGGSRRAGALRPCYARKILARPSPPHILSSIRWEMQICVLLLRSTYPYLDTQRERRIKPIVFYGPINQSYL